MKIIGENGTLLSEIWDESEDGEWIYKNIPSGKEIVGVYGNTTSNPWIEKCGFMLWTTNPKLQ